MTQPDSKSPIQNHADWQKRQSDAVGGDSKSIEGDKIMDLIAGVAVMRISPAQAFAQLNRLLEEARINELEKAIEVSEEELYHGRAMAEGDGSTGLVYGVEQKYFKDRILELKKDKI